ncbi:MAG: LamG-like jellyroll fold domain-containing protein [Anaerovoracaceae bacterium]|jgi:uncharacterized repeat protein (TIGR02543 family)
MRIKRLLAGLLSGVIALSGFTLGNAAVRAGEQSGQETPTALTQEMVDTANDAYNNNSNAAMEFISMSDTHAASYEQKHWAFENIRKWSEKKGFNTATVMVGGDVEANEREEQAGNSVRFYTAVQQLMNETFGNLPVQFCRGNHDIQSSMEKVFDQYGWADHWYYKGQNGSYYNNFHIKVNGYDFITLDYHSYSSFLDSTLNEIKNASDYDPKKPIFIQIHSGLSGTTTGSYQDLGSGYLQSRLADWPQAVVMTAHSHYGAEEETGIYQKNFTVVNNGSMDYLEVSSDGFLENSVLNWIQGDLENKHNELTCNYITVQKDGTTVIRRFDVTNQRWMGMPWVIDTKAGRDGFRYTPGQRDKTAPWFEDSAEAKMENITENSADLVFDQAVDNQLVQHYRISLKNARTNEDASYSVIPEKFDYDMSPKGVTGSFKSYSRFYIRPYPKQLKYYFTKLKKNTTYRVSITAVDSFGNESEDREFKFKTAGESEQPVTTLPESLKNGKFLDMDFDNEDLKDSANQINASANGNITYTDGIKGRGVHIPSGNENYVSLGKDDRMSGDSNLTMNFWINSASVSSDAAIISNKNWYSGGNDGWYVGFRLSSLDSVGFNAAASGTRMDFDASASFKDKWKMVTVSIDRDTKKVTIYIDGAESSASTNLSMIDGSFNAGLPVNIGVDGAAGNGGADFVMDGLQMWNRVLTADEIKAIYDVTTYHEDTTNYAEKLAGLIKDAESLLAKYNEGGENGITYSKKAAENLKKALDEAEKAQTKEEQQDACGELAYRIEKMNASMKVTTMKNADFSVACCDSWHGDHGEGDYGESRLYAPEKAIDDENGTAWHTNWSSDANGAIYKFPHTIIIDTKKTHEITGIQRVGRANRDYIRRFTVDASDDLEALKADETPDYTGMFADRESDYQAIDKTLTGRYIKVTILDTWLMQDGGHENWEWAYTGEIAFTGHEKKVSAKVTLNGSGGTGTTLTEYTPGEEIQLPSDWKRDGYTFAGWYDNADFTGSPITAIPQNATGDLTFYAKWKKNEPVEPDHPGVKTTDTDLLNLKVTAAGRHTQKLTWKKIPGATRYTVYARRGDGNFRAYRTVRGTQLTRKGLRNGRLYKYRVRAYKTVNGKKKILAESLKCYSIAGGSSKSYTDAKSVRTASRSLTLKAGSSAKIRASLTKVKKHRNFLSERIVKHLRYASSNTKVCRVNASGKVTAKKAGTCRIYVYAPNGVYASVKVKVK